MNAILGDNGIITKAKEAKELSEKTGIIEDIKLEIVGKRMQKDGSMTTGDVVEVLSKYGTVNFEEDGVTVKSVTTEKGYEILLEEIMMEDKIVEVADGSYDFGKHVNTPQLLTGMTPVKFEYPTDEAKGEKVETTIQDKTWYEYGTTYETKKWANAVTKDSNGEISGYWVWIPRFAYKINSDEQTTDVVFLIGTTDKYYDENGNIQTAQRCTSEDEYVETDSTKTDKYTVHPAFTDESSINYRNGGWDEELSGIWVAKFEAGFASGNNNVEVKASSINYSQSTVWAANIEAGTTNEEG